MNNENKPEKTKTELFFENAGKTIKKNLIEWWHIFKLFWKKYHLTKVVILAVLSLALFISTYFYLNAKFFTDVEDLKANLEQQTVVYDGQNEAAGTLYSQKGTSISFEEMSPYIPQAVVASEDKRFYDHMGFDPIGIARAAAGYVFAGGNVVGGGSTITQQLAKNAFLSADQTITRKIEELFIAIEIEKTYTKEEILAMYLNNSYFGNGVWGVEDASHKYFGQPASDVSLSESAALAGMLPSPSTLNPIDDAEASKNTRDTVLYLMADQQLITQEASEMAQAEPFYLSDTYVDTANYAYPYYFDAVIDEAINNHGFEEEELLNNGYQIYTTLNQPMQGALQNIYSQDWLFPSASDGTPVQSASVAVDPNSGSVLALVGGRGEHTFRGYNRATQMRRQPGSVIKPLSVFLPALEAGYEPSAVLPDQEMSYGPEEYTPYNADNTFSEDGEVYMYEALARSLNAPAVWLLDEIGLNRGVRQLEELNLSVNQEDENLAAIALGGTTAGFTPLEVANAYTIFANSGSQYEPHLIRQIVDSQGNIVVDNTNPVSDRITSEETANQMTSMLLDVYSDYGTAGYFEPEGYQIAGKTGTTDARFDTGVTDKWLVGYTPDLVVTGWMGFDEPSEVHSLTSDHVIGNVVERELQAMLPYTSGTTFAGAPASETVEADEGFNFEGIGESVGEFFNGISDGVGNLIEQGDNFLRNLIPE